ncbi:MAG: hypothetical protein R6U93_06560 [Dehalococcoidia bacterium]
MKAICESDGTETIMKVMVLSGTISWMSTESPHFAVSREFGRCLAVTEVNM